MEYIYCICNTSATYLAIEIRGCSINMWRTYDTSCFPCMGNTSPTSIAHVIHLQHTLRLRHNTSITYILNKKNIP